MYWVPGAHGWFVLFSVGGNKHSMGCFQMLREFSIVSGREFDGDALEALDVVMHGHKHNLLFSFRLSKKPKSCWHSIRNGNCNPHSVLLYEHFFSKIDSAERDRVCDQTLKWHLLDHFRASRDIRMCSDAASAPPPPWIRLTNVYDHDDPWLGTWFITKCYFGGKGV